MIGTAVTTVDGAIDGPHGPIPVRRYSPPAGTAPASSATIVWLHGGGFMWGGLDQLEADAVARALAQAGFRVVTVAYRLAKPGSGIRFPVPLDDVVAVVGALQHENRAGVILGGASAGACLSAGAVLRLADTGAPALRGVFFAYGFFHATLPKRPPELVRRLRGRRRVTHAPAGLDAMNRHYAGTRAALLDPHAFAGGHPLQVFPASLVINADRDSMRASGAQFVRELEQADVAVESHVLPGSFHAFLNRPLDAHFAEGVRLISEWAART